MASDSENNERSNMTLQDKFAHLLSEPIYSFNPFGAILVAECWLLTGGLVAMADNLPEGRKNLLLDLYESRAGAAHRNSPLDRSQRA